MSNYQLQITLRSDTALGRGDGVAGLVNTEVQHDSFGCPYLGGRTLKGLLREECVNLLYLLREMDNKKGTAHFPKWRATAHRLFGQPGSTLEEGAVLYISDATLAEDLRQAITYGVDAKQLTRTQVLDSLTAIRYQTAVDAETEAPRKESLRAIRVVLRNTVFTAQLSLRDLSETTEEQGLALLAACVKALRAAGTGRNRGVGEIRAQLLDGEGNVLPSTILTNFEDSIKEEVPNA